MTPRAAAAPAGAPASAPLSTGLTEDLGEEGESASGFSVTLTNFAGPFDVLLSLIARRRMDITEVALAEVTDEFLAYVRDLDTTGEDGTELAVLDASSGFLVVAATLLDLKTARLLPAGSADSEEDVALLEARDLLFARLLQYKAFKDVAGLIRTRMEAESRRAPRSVTLDPRLASALPALMWTLTPEQFGAIAEEVLGREPAGSDPDEVGLTHLHAPPVSVREQGGLLADRLRAQRRLTFTELVSDAGSLAVVVARFLALLEMFRDRVVTFDQEVPLGELTVLWDPGAPDRVDGPDGEAADDDSG